MEISREEAIKIIAPLCNQIEDGNPNTGRREFYTDDGEYFSISVICKDQTTKQYIKNFKGNEV